MSNRDRAAEVLHDADWAHQWGTDTCRLTPCQEEARNRADALVAAGLIHVGQRFCTKVANCRMADGHANGCVRT